MGQRSGRDWTSPPFQNIFANQIVNVHIYHAQSHCGPIQFKVWSSITVMDKTAVFRYGYSGQGFWHLGITLTSEISQGSHSLPSFCSFSSTYPLPGPVGMFSMFCEFGSLWPKLDPLPLLDPLSGMSFPASSLRVTNFSGLLSTYFSV